MDEVVFMNRLDSEDQLCHVEFRLLFSKNVLFHEQSHQIPSGQELHDKVQIFVVLEGAVHLNDPLVALG